MTPYVKSVVGVSLVILFLQVSVLAAQQTKLAPAAPIPQQITAAKKVFIANAGGDERRYEAAIFSGGPERVYDELYAAVRAGGRYQIVGTPADADLLIEIGLTAPASGVGYDPQFRLAIRDPKTNALLWAFTEHVQWAIQQGNRDKNFDQTLARIISDLQGLSGSSDTANRP